MKQLAMGFAIFWLVIVLKGVKSYTVKGFSGFIMAGIIMYGLGEIVVLLAKL